MKGTIRFLILFTLVVAPLFGTAAHLEAQIATSMTLTANPSTVASGGAVTLTATVTVASGPVSNLDYTQIYFQSPDIFADAFLIDGVASAVIDPVYTTANGGTESITSSMFNLPYGYTPSTANTTVTVITPSTNTLATGQYIFLMQGIDAAAVGSLALDGKGNVSGEEDLNTSQGVTEALAVTGTYAFSQQGVGTLTLVSAQGTQKFAVFLPSLPQLTTPTSATLLETDGSFVAKGSLAVQESGYAAIDLSGTFSLDLSGDTACGDCSTYGHDTGQVLVSGQLVLNNSGQGPLSAAVSQSIGSTVIPNTALSGQYALSDSLGRFLFTASAPQGFGANPTHFVGYAADFYHIALLSLDSHAKAILISGTGRGDK